MNSDIVSDLREQIQKVMDLIKSVIGKLGENIKLREFKRFAI